MAEIIHLRKVLQARRREQQQTIATQCVEILEYSLHHHLEEFGQAPPHEWAARASRIRKLGELLEYSTNMI